ncbi:MAG TPA: DUF4861 family protein [Opitutaceae bacterium]|nr:DUF4861 family protein [Opitutaceae bacterium]
MKTPPRALLVLFALASVAGLRAAVDKFTVTVTNDLDIARPAEVIVVPWGEIAGRLPPHTLPSHIAVKDAGGALVPDQLINFRPEERRDYYQSLIFQHDFAAGEHTATFTIEKTDAPIPPFPAKVFARYVPERFDDFAWENDRIAHRIYGQALETPVAGKDQMVSSGVDVWAKRVRYPIVDRWYLMGHYHEDTGEGLDMYDVGTSRGDGGTGIWDGKALHVSHNWKTWKVLANGPVRVVFELTYEPWDAGNGVMVAETKHFIVDAGHNLDDVTSTFTFQGHETLTVALGLGKHPKAASDLTKQSDEKESWLTVWEKYPRASIGCAVAVDPDAFAGFAEDGLNHLLLANVKSGQPLHYFLGACWDKSGDFAAKDDWSSYVAAAVERAQSPLKVSFGAAP